MFKLIFVGAWGCLVAIGAGYFAQRFTGAPDQTTAPKAVTSIESRRTPELNIPKIKNGAISGYVVALVGYDVDAGALKSASIPPDPVVVDETIRYLYNDQETDFSNLKPIDVSRMAATIKKDVNARVGSDVIIDVTLQELNLLGKEQIEKPL
jgi:hypothetical protein